MCIKCQTLSCNCETKKKVDFTKPIRFISTNPPRLSEIIAATKHPRREGCFVITAVYHRDSSASSSFTFDVDEYGVYLSNKDYNVSNAPPPRVDKKVTVVTLMSKYSGCVMQRTEAAYKTGSYRSYVVLKTEEIVYQE